MRRAVLFTGSRNWTDVGVVRDIVAHFPPDTIVIHGAARGLDFIVDQVAGAAGLKVEAYPADWTSYGKSAGHKRNAQMLLRLLALRNEGYDVSVCAFPLGESRGTRGMMKIAKAAGVRVDDYGRKDEV